MSPAFRQRVLVLDDGDTWECITGSSNAMVVDVSAEEAERLHDGERASDVLEGRTGRRLGPLLEAAFAEYPAVERATHEW